MIDPAIKKEIYNLSRFKQYQYLLCAKQYVESRNVEYSTRNLHPDVQHIFSRTKFTNIDTFIQEIHDIIKDSMKC